MTCMTTVTNSWDELSNICSSIMADGARLTGMSYGQFSLTMFGVLLPGAALFFLIAASLALSGKTVARRIAMVVLGLGVILLAAFIAAMAYAVICGSTWAYSS